VRRSGVLFAVLIAALGVARADEPARRVISLNLCTDQLLVALAPPERILGVSPYGRREGLPMLSGTAEEAIMLRPDLVVAGLRDRRITQEMIRRQGLRIETFDIVGSLAEARAQLLRMGKLLGAEDRAGAMVALLDAARERLRQAAAGAPGQAGPLSILPYSRRGWVEGSDGLVGEILREAGLTSAAGEAGLRGGGFIGLEALVRLRPDALLLTDGGTLAEGGISAEDQGSALLLHPALARLYPEARRLRLPGTRAICGGPGLIAAIDSLAAQVARLAAPP
jgi:iron complex transport system substrate-binding protein